MDGWWVKLTETMIENKNAQRVFVKKGNNPISIHEHQSEAIKKLNEIDKKKEFNSLLVLPTGAGKTLTAAHWLLTNAVDKKKKVLWIAHRHLLLEQAADSFIRNSYSNLLHQETGFNYRIISGVHDKPIHIMPKDDVLFASKDSLVRNLDLIGKWLNKEDVYLIIDEAHHATAKSYKKIIDFVKGASSNMKLLGLTATPFRTSEDEKALLGKIFTDDIVYKTDLMTLINRGILSTPYPEVCDTKIELGDLLGSRAIKSIENLDSLPIDIAEEIAKNSKRNHLIVKRYMENQEKYGKTLVFALNRIHAFSLQALFKKNNVKAGVIVSGTQAEFIGIDISNEENEKQINAFKNDDMFKVLINVNILTEGADLPKTQTVFLTRPTISTVLMTQMVGRALRGEKAGGTSTAYIVSFVDDWNNKIAWVNPETILIDGPTPAITDSDYKKKNIRLISISKMEEFARLVDDTVDTKSLENIDFIKRIPIGMYVFSFIDENSTERNYQILVYDSTKEAYENMISALPDLFKEYRIEEETIEPSLLNDLCKVCETAYFYSDMMPPYNEKDIESLLKFYAQKEIEPWFVPIDQIDRNKLDLALIAKDIVDKDMRRREQEDYVNGLWEEESSLLKIYFERKYFFKRQLETEIDKILNPEDYMPKYENAEPEKRDVKTLTLYEIKLSYPELYRELTDPVYQSARDNSGNYHCPICGKTSKAKAVFQIDHIIPMSCGGFSEPGNLQLLCRTCNMQKGAKLEV